jgi:hypothetical protein
MMPVAFETNLLSLWTIRKQIVSAPVVKGMMRIVKNPMCPYSLMVWTSESRMMILSLDRQELDCLTENNSYLAL